jgi:hypothetical protein
LTKSLLFDERLVNDAAEIRRGGTIAIEDLRDQLPIYALGARGGQFLLRINRLLTPCASRGNRTFSAAILGGLCSTIAVILLCNQLLIGAAADRVRGRYARAVLVMASQEEMLAGTLPLRRLLSDTLFLPLAQLTPQQGQRIRRASAEHERVTALAQELKRETLNKLGGDNQRGRESKQLNPQHELDRLVALAAHRADIQLGIVKLYVQWLAVADNPSKAIALAAARSWRKSIPDAVFARWLNDAETGRWSSTCRADDQFRWPTKNFSGSMTPVESPLVVK